MAASALYNRATFKEAELVALLGFSVITQRALGQICAVETNASPLLSLSLTPSPYPPCPHTRALTLRPSVAPCVCNMGGPGVTASVSLRTGGEAALMSVSPSSSFSPFFSPHVSL